MTKFELEIEHYYQGRFLGRHILRDVSQLVVLGSARDSSIRLMGDGVSPIHASIDFRTDHWIVSDLGSQSGVLVRNKPVVEYKLKKVTELNIGEHVLKATPKVIQSQLFSKEPSRQGTEPAGTRKFHQVVVRKAGLVTETHLLGGNEPFNLTIGGESVVLAPPKDSGWNNTEFSDVEVLNRLVSSSTENFTSVEKLKSFMDPSLKKPMMGAFIALVLFAVAVLIQPTLTKEEEKLEDPNKNKYTKVIFDAKSVRKKRAQAKKLQHKIKNQQTAKTSAGAKNIKTTMPKSAKSKAVVKVVNNLKASGLTKLIGKIAKRASKTSHLINATGKKAGSASAGRALASVGKSNFGSPNSKVGKSFKVKGVATSGIGGGKEGATGMAGLASGGIGSADVGVLEEETVVEGGLARDVIARTIQKYLGEIRYCYERQLAANPELYGKVLVRFTIGPGGQVKGQGVGSSTMNNAMVEGCMLRKVSRWRFPKPKGGTEVSVTYPFLFKSTQ